MPGLSVMPDSPEPAGRFVGVFRLIQPEKVHEPPETAGARRSTGSDEEDDELHRKGQRQDVQERCGLPLAPQPDVRGDAEDAGERETATGTGQVTAETHDEGACGRDDGGDDERNAGPGAPARLLRLVGPSGRPRAAGAHGRHAPGEVVGRSTVGWFRTAAG